jgi:EmrB/QacA subfamily drug resistance transporter
MVQGKAAQTLAGSQRELQGGAADDAPHSTSNRLDGPLLRIALVFVLGSFMSVLDSTIVNVAIKELSRDFDSPLATIQWVATGYLLSLAMVIPLTGWGSDRFGTKRVFNTAIALFVIGSGLSGAAWSADSLIFFRVLQGFGGGMIVPAGMAILTRAAGPDRVGRVMGIVGVPVLLAPILGPMAGGYFVDYASWRWIFFVNVPIGAAAIFAAAKILPPDEPKPHDKLDWIGLLLLSPGLAAVVYGLAGLTMGGSGSTGTLVWSGLGLALICGFIAHARDREGSLIDVRLFARGPVFSSAITTFFSGGTFFGLSLIMPLYFQFAHGKTAFEAGTLIAVQGLGAMITMPVAGRLTDKIGAGKIVLAGLVVFALGLIGLSQTGAATPAWAIELALFVTGLGSGSTMMPAMSAVLRVLKRAEVSRATTGLNVALRVGGSIGTALVAVVLTQQLSRVLGSTGGLVSAIDALRTLAPADRAQTMAALGPAFGHVFLWLLGSVAFAFCGALFIPRRRLEPNAAEASAAALAESS